MGNYQIKDLENITGIKAHTIRIWEQRYGIVTPQRTETNVRYYTDTDARLLMNVALLNKNGVKISRIKDMSTQQITQEAMRYAFSSLEYPIQIDALTGSMVALDEARFEKILSNNILQAGFEKAITNVVFPFLKRIGIMWQTGSVNPAQEHFISNLIRQKIIVAIDALPTVSDTNFKNVLLFLPEHEQHEHSLLFTNYLFKSRGYHTIYLGQKTPTTEVITLTHDYKPNYLFSVFTSGITGDALTAYIHSIADACAPGLFFITGHQVLETPRQWPSNVQVIKNFDDLYTVFETDKPLISQAKA